MARSVGIIFTAANLLGSPHAFEKLALAQPFKGISSVFGLKTLEEVQKLDADLSKTPELSGSELSGGRGGRQSSREISAASSEFKQSDLHQELPVRPEFREASQVAAQELLQSKVLNIGPNMDQFIQGSKEFFRGFAELMARENIPNSEALRTTCSSLAESAADPKSFRTFFNQFENIETALYKLEQPAKTQIQATIDQYKVALLTQALLDPQQNKEHGEQIKHHLEGASQSVLGALQENLKTLEGQAGSNALLQAAQEQVGKHLEQQARARSVASR